MNHKHHECFYFSFQVIYILHFIFSAFAFHSPHQRLYFTKQVAGWETNKFHLQTFVYGCHIILLVTEGGTQNLRPLGQPLLGEKIKFASKYIISEICLWVSPYSFCNWGRHAKKTQIYYQYLYLTHHAPRWSIL